MHFPKAPTTVLLAALSGTCLSGCTTVNTVVTPTQQTNSSAIATGMPAVSGQVALASAHMPQRPGARPAPRQGWPPDEAFGGKVPQENATYRGTLPFLNYDVPLPDGDWTVIARNVIMTPTGPANLRVALERNDGSELTGLMLLGGNPPNKPFPNGLPVSPICTTSDSIIADARQAEPGGNQDCAIIDFRRSTFLRDTTSVVFVRLAGRSLDQHNVSPPATLVGTTFVVANRTHSLVGDVFFNPDRDGIAPDLATQRGQSGWAAFNIDKDPRKQAFAQHVLRWSRGWRDALKLVLAGQTPRLPPDVATTP
jgi:hypothetical protein